jgi:hypothetical protein
LRRRGPFLEGEAEWAVKNERRAAASLGGETEEEEELEKRGETSSGKEPCLGLKESGRGVGAGEMETRWRVAKRGDCSARVGGRG